MPDLTDERVREIAELRGFRLSNEEGVSLARMVLDRGEQLAAVPTCACGDAFTSAAQCLGCLGRDNDAITRLLPRQQHLRPNVAEWTLAEAAIYEAMQIVEVLGCSTALTEASTLLGYARDKVAEHVLAVRDREG